MDSEGKTLPTLELELYSKIMTRVKLRIEEARGLVFSAKDERDAVYAAIQLRLAIEEVAVASFVGNRPLLENLNMNLAKVSWKTSRSQLKQLNSRYWPEGIRQIRHEDGSFEWASVEDAIPESEVPEIWGKLSSLLHARSPFTDPTDWPRAIQYQKTLVKRLISTFNEHILHLHDSDLLVCGQFWADPPNFYIFKAVDADPEC